MRVHPPDASASPGPSDASRSHITGACYCACAPLAKCWVLRSLQCSDFNFEREMRCRERVEEGVVPSLAQQPEKSVKILDSIAILSCYCCRLLPFMVTDSVYHFAYLTLFNRWIPLAGGKEKPDHTTRHEQSTVPERGNQAHKHRVCCGASTTIPADV